MVYILVQDALEKLELHLRDVVQEDSLLYGFINCSLSSPVQLYRAVVLEVGVLRIDVEALFSVAYDFELVRLIGSFYQVGRPLDLGQVSHELGVQGHAGYRMVEFVHSENVLHV